MNKKKEKKFNKRLNKALGIPKSQWKLYNKFAKKAAKEICAEEDKRILGELKTDFTEGTKVIDFTEGKEYYING